MSVTVRAEDVPAAGVDHLRRIADRAHFHRSSRGAYGMPPGGYRRMFPHMHMARGPSDADAKRVATDFEPAPRGNTTGA
jgi:hypothetical protein